MFISDIHVNEILILSNFLYVKAKNTIECGLLLTKEILFDDFTVGHSHQISQRKVVNRNVATVEQQ